MNKIKKTAQRKNKTRSEKAFVDAQERRYLVTSTTKTTKHDFIGNSQELRLLSLRVKEYNPDIVTGKGPRTFLEVPEGCQHYEKGFVSKHFKTTTPTSQKKMPLQIVMAVVSCSLEPYIEGSF